MTEKEKVRELAMELREKTIPSGYEVVITEWLEQNPIEPQVVGLSDEQVRDVAQYQWDKMSIFSVEMCEELISKWQKTQTFKEPCECGLNVSQIHKDQFKDLQVAYKVLAEREKELEQWREDFVEMESEYSKVKKELEQLKSQQFTPNWDNAPVSATSCHLKRVWVNENGIGIDYAVLLDIQRPKPTPQVGQVWKCSKNQQDYTVTEITTLECETKMNDGDWESNMQLIAYRHVKACELKTYHRKLSDFLAKFEMVQP